MDSRSHARNVRSLAQWSRASDALFSSNRAPKIGCVKTTLFLDATCLPAHVAILACSHHDPYQGSSRDEMTLKQEYRVVQAVDTNLVTFTGLMRNGFDSRPKGLPEGSSSMSTSGACDIVFIIISFCSLSVRSYRFSPSTPSSPSSSFLLRTSLFCPEAQKGRHGTCSYHVTICLDFPHRETSTPSSILILILILISARQVEQLSAQQQQGRASIPHGRMSERGDGDAGYNLDLS